MLVLHVLSVARAGDTYMLVLHALSVQKELYFAIVIYMFSAADKAS